MAKYSITSLNYISAGKNRTLLNMDILLEYQIYDVIHLLRLDEAPQDGSNPILSDIVCEASEYVSSDFISKEFDGQYDLNTTLSNAIALQASKYGILLNEQQPWISTDLSVRDYIRLYLSSDNEEYREQAKKFNAARAQLNVTYLYENGSQTQVPNINLDVNDPRLINDDGNVTSIAAQRLMSIFDLKDVSIKSINKQTNAYMLLYDINHSKRTEDIYLPQLEQDPVGFCQVDNQTYVLTQPTTKGPVCLRSDLMDTRGITSTRTTWYTQHLKSLPHGTALLPSHQLLKTDSYRTWLSAGGDPSDLFTPALDVQNVEYSYIAQIANNSSEDDFYDGNVHGQMYTTKSMYNSTYDMEMSALSSLDNCRTYVGLGTSGGKMYLKYYDNVDYKIHDTSSKVGSTTTVQAEKQQHLKYPYQKIEFFCPHQFKTNALHKTNYYSVKIRNSNFSTLEEEIKEKRDVESSDKQLKILESFKKDISNAIREICQNVAPADTQLFDVIIED